MLYVVCTDNFSNVKITNEVMRDNQFEELYLLLYLYNLNNLVPTNLNKSIILILPTLKVHHFDETNPAQ